MDDSLPIQPPAPATHRLSRHPGEIGERSGGGGRRFFKKRAQSDASPKDCLEREEIVELGLALELINVQLEKAQRPFRLEIVLTDQGEMLFWRDIAGRQQSHVFGARSILEVPFSEIEALLTSLETGQGILFDSDA